MAKALVSKSTARYWAKEWYKLSVYRGVKMPSKSLPKEGVTLYFTRIDDKILVSYHRTEQDHSFYERIYVKIAKSWL